MARRSFLEKTLNGLHGAVERALWAEEIARRDGFLQRLDPRAKLLGMLALIVAAASSHSLQILFLLFILSLVLALRSRVSLRELALRVWLGAFFFGGIVALPALFLTPGAPLIHLPLVPWPITETGARNSVLLLARVETAATLATLLMVCTPWAHLLKALRALGVPVVGIVILGMTHRYIWVLVNTAHEIIEARRARLCGALPSHEKRRMAASSLGVLLGKSLHLSEEIYLAMISRGFRGEARTLDDFGFTLRDDAALACACVCSAGAWYWGR
jgi:cobalt ECF transporter T component CbiQ